MFSAKFSSRHDVYDETRQKLGSSLLLVAVLLHLCLPAALVFCVVKLYLVWCIGVHAMYQVTEVGVNGDDTFSGQWRIICHFINIRLTVTLLVFRLLERWPIKSFLFRRMLQLTLSVSIWWSKLYLFSLFK